MSTVHKELAEGRWAAFSLCTQLAHVGSEVERALNWETKGNSGYKQMAFFRALELIDLTLRDPKNRGRLREIARAREVLADYFVGGNTFRSTESQWRNYYRGFAYAARLGR